MKASCNWLNELTGLTLDPTTMAERLTRAGLEVEGLTRVGRGLEHVIVAAVRGQRPHPTKPKLSLVTVYDGRAEREVVCGAPNVPGPGALVVLADVGARLPGGVEIVAREVAGVLSAGMLASEKELGIGSDGDGILVLDPGTALPGRPFASVARFDDTILEIGLTPNRADCLGHVGIARELCALFEHPYVGEAVRGPLQVLSVRPEPPGGTDAFETVDPAQAREIDTGNLLVPEDGVPLVVPITIEGHGRCPRYVGTVLQRVHAARSPIGIRARLHALGQRSIDAVVDATNLVMLERGHPIHAFDLDTIRGREIRVRLARPGEAIALLDGTARSLTEDDLVIADAAGPIALAGVMGGAETAVTARTRTILVEVALFDPRSVRRTARRHGIHTESSHRFERGVDPGELPTVVRRAVSLLTGLTRAGVAPIAVDVHPRPQAQTLIVLAPRFVKESLGDESITELEMRTVLEGLGCTLSPADPGTWRVSVPTHRGDLQRPIDLVEEIARVRGYDRIPSRMLRIEPRVDPGSPKPRLLKRLRHAAMAAGLHEAVNFTFLAPSDLTRARVDLDALKLLNPLSEERSVLRTSLVPSLLDDVSRAERHQRASGRLFEIGKTFHPTPDAPAREVTRLAIVLFGPRSAWISEDGRHDFYDGKGALERTFRALGLELEYEFADPAPAWAHPRRAARLALRGQPLGFLAEVHPEVIEAYGLSARPVLAELDLTGVLSSLASSAPRTVRPLPRFQAAERDLALVVDAAVPYTTLRGAMRNAGGPLVEDISVFDEYRGRGIPEGRRSLALRVRLRDADATLTETRIEDAMARVVQAALALGAEVRA